MLELNDDVLDSLDPTLLQHASPTAIERRYLAQQIFLTLVQNRASTFTSLQPTPAGRDAIVQTAAHLAELAVLMADGFLQALE